MKSIRIVLCAAFLMMMPVALMAAPGASLLGSAKTEHAEVTLIADVASIKPGQPFLLGVKFTLDPHWHIYWQNSGDTGLKTEVEWVLPKGFKAGPLQFPVPEKFEIAGLVTYGYHDEVVLFSEVTPPEDLPSGTVELSADASWLICKEVCLRGESSPSAKLRVDPNGGTPSQEASLLHAMQARVPREKAEHISIEISRENFAAGVVRLTAKPNDGWKVETTDDQKNRAEFFPRLNDGWIPTHAQVDKLTPEAVEFRWPVERDTNEGEKSAVLHGVARVPLVNGSGEKFVEVLEVALAAPDETALAGAASGSDSGLSANANGGSVNAADSSTDVASGGPSAAASQALVEPKWAPNESMRLSFLDEKPESKHGLVYFLLLAFAGGIILNVMPCVLPVISLKIMGFVNQAGESPRKIMMHGLVFAAGVLVSFAALAAILIVVKQTAGVTGWGFQFQNPAFVIVMTTVVFAFGLSMLGVFEVDLPWKAQRALGQASESQGGMAGSFTNGVMATALSTPCSAPFLGPALGFALGQSNGVIVLFLMTIGLGLALPYVLLSANPKWLKQLPKPGAWMETFKQSMGFLLLAMVVWLLTVLNGQLGGEGVIQTLMFLLVVGIGCWLYGLLSDPLRRGKGPARAFALPILIVLVVGGYLALPGSYLKAMAELKQRGESSERIEWQPFSVAHVENLVADNRTVFLDFTADWCLSCKVNEKVALETDAVRQALSLYNVVPVKADWTNYDEDIGNVLAQLGRSAVPTYVIFPAGRAHEPVVLSETLTAGYVVDKLREASATRLAAR